MALDVQVKKMVMNFTQEKSEWFVASAQRGNVVSHQALVKQVAYESGQNRAVISAVISAFKEALMTYLNEGHGVRMEGFGTFYPTVSSRSSRDAEGVGVKRVRVAFTPCKEFRMRINDISLTTENTFTKKSPSAGSGNQEGGNGGNQEGGGIEGI